jgi:hypothetical protein
MKPKDSPYLKHPQRLADIMAAIQVMAESEWDRRTLDDWKRFLGEKPVSAKVWKEVFESHPEFFGIEPRKKGGENAFLRVRRAFKRYDIEEPEKELSHPEAEELIQKDASVEDRLTRKPLSDDLLEVLLKIAIEQQARALALVEAGHWWVSPVSALLGVILGAVLAAVLHVKAG